ncbi:MAG: TadE/TadG family type IV pilus assembly protein [Rhodospirillales bacterium]
MRKVFTLFGRRRDGATAVEFALVAPAFFMVMWGTVEVGMLSLASTLLEGAVREASRVGMTGYAPAGTAQIDHVKNTIKKYTVNFLDIDKLKIDTKSYTGFGNVGQPEAFVDKAPFNGKYDAGETFTDTNGNGKWDSDQGKPGLGDPGSVVVYTLSYDWAFFAGYAKEIFGTPSVTLRSTIAVRNEPY